MKLSDFILNLIFATIFSSVYKYLGYNFIYNFIAFMIFATIFDLVHRLLFGNKA